MLHRLTNVFHPARFQGSGKRRRYFEGYYLKVVDPGTGLALALIPGVSYEASGEGHAFVQVVDGIAGTAAYHRFPIEQFAFAKTSFGLTIAEHLFAVQGIKFSTEEFELIYKYYDAVPWPRHWYSPGAMGPFTFAPGMECRHGVVSLHHRVTGFYNGQKLSPQAVGYIEKDWGRSFPRNWVWLQSNHLDVAAPGAPCCVMVSAGRVPFAGTHFQGFIAAVLWEGELYRFTTYNGCRMQLDFGDGYVDLHFRSRTLLSLRKNRLDLHIRAYQAPGIDLVAPAGAGGMIGRVNESLQATADLRLQRGSKILLETKVRWMSFEVGGEWE